MQLNEYDLVFVINLIYSLAQHVAAGDLAKAPRANIDMRF